MNTVQRQRTSCMSRMRSSGGSTAVEFAIVASTLLLTIFIVIDLSRLVYLRMTLEEGVRRGARLAAVCPIGDPWPARAAVLADPAAQGAAIPAAGLSNVSIQYLNADGAVIANPVASFTSIALVRVSLLNVQTPLLVPFVSGVFAPTNVSSTAGAESLGVSPTAVTPC
jgi:Flp pilus assembly protein TadG